jgi:2-octaprenylphenol hydroxylase
VATEFDIVIVGGGIAGSALAAALAGSSLQVAVVEAAAISDVAPACSREVNDFDSRVSALTPASQDFLEGLGAWPRMAAIKVSPYQKMHVWDADGTGAIDFSAAEMRQPRLGHIVENRVSVWALRQILGKAANITLLDGYTVAELLPRAGVNVAGEAGYSLLLGDGSQLDTGLVVAADGALSSIRRFAGFNTREWDYQHVATVTTVATEFSHQQTAWQRFLPEGPLAFLPLASADQKQCSIVWSAAPELAEQIRVMDDARFCDALGAAFEHRLGRILHAAPRASYPLRQRHATRYYKAGLVLVGDAAHTIHPLAGQGINLGLKDVEVLSQELLRAVEHGLAPGLPAVLSRFQRRRMADNLTMMLAMDGFKRLFSQRNLGVRWLRNTGMKQMNRMPLVKRQIMQQAMGL